VENSTREDLLLAAERIFATQGVDATSLRQISAESGQRNTAAAQYHFQNKPNILRAIFAYRLDAIDARRRELLRAADEAGSLTEPRALVEVLVRPLAEQATRPGSHYVRYLRRVLEYAGRDLALLPEIGGLEEAVAVGRLVGERLPHLAAAKARLWWAAQLVITAVADLEQDCAATENTAEGPDAEAVTLDVVDAVTGLLTAPVSPRPA
jgi:AcrR family transcriptional regulator